MEDYNKYYKDRYYKDRYYKDRYYKDKYCKCYKNEFDDHSIEINVNCCSDHNKNKKDDHKKHDDCCCGHKEVERQVNNPTDDVDNLPRITQSETSIAHFNDFILYGFNDSNDDIGGAGKASFSGFSFSNNLGKTWIDGGSIPVKPGGINAGDPSIAVDRNGIFYYGQVGSEVIEGNSEDVISVSTGTINPNGTITMNEPQVVGRGQNLGNNNPNVIFEQDKEWITIGPDANTPGNQALNEALYVAWTDFNCPNPGTRIRFSKFSTGVTLNPIIPSTTIVSGTNETFGAFPVVDSRGNIYVFYESRLPGSFVQLGTPNRSIRMVKSTDGGTSFPINVQVSNGFFAAAATDVISCGEKNDRPVILVAPQREIRMFEIPQAAIGSDGTIYVVWNAGTIVGNKTYIDVFLAYSQDEGNSWNQVKITNNLSHSFFPSVAVNCKGAHIQYNRFNDPNGVGGVGDKTFGIFMKTFSLDTGLSEERMVSTQFSPVPITNPSPGGDVGRCYMAEYNQVITGPGSCLLHSWGDNRNTLNGRINPDVFFKLTTPKKKHDNCCD
ncbi:exo-alpha-sialidase [Bacillus paranthracis]|uniref:exo-alpha-sialidase n=1 Tax=Bacillus paranthracis TaxID=2026186 RepID=UPI000A9EAD5F